MKKRYKEVAVISQSKEMTIAPLTLAYSAEAAASAAKAGHPPQQPLLSLEAGPSVQGRIGPMVPPAGGEGRILRGSPTMALGVDVF